MISQLRKRHRWMWGLLSLTIPILFTISILNRPGLIPFEAIDDTTIEATIDGSTVRVKINKPVKSAFTEVYGRHGSSCEKTIFLGIAGSVGEYSYSTQGLEGFCEVYLFDQLNNIELDRASIK